MRAYVCLWLGGRVCVCMHLNCYSCKAYTHWKTTPTYLHIRNTTTTCLHHPLLEPQRPQSRPHGLLQALQQLSCRSGRCVSVCDDVMMRGRLVWYDEGIIRLREILPHVYTYIHMN